MGSSTKDCQQVIKAVLLFYSFATLSLVLTRGSEALSFVWLANSVAGLYLANQNRRILLFSLPLLALSNIVADYPFSGSLLHSFLFIPANLIEVILIYYFYRSHFIKQENFSLTSVSFIKLSAFAVVIPSLIGSVLGSISLFIADKAPLYFGFISWFQSAAVGGLIVFPLIFFTQFMGAQKSKEILTNPKSILSIVSTLLLTLLAFYLIPYPFIYIAALIVSLTLFNDKLTIAVSAAAFSFFVIAFVSTGLFDHQLNTNESHLFYIPLLLSTYLPMVFRISFATEKSSKNKLKRQASALSSMYTQTPAIVHSLGDDGKIQFVSDHWLRFSGYNSDEVIGRSSVEFLTEKSAKYAKETVLPNFYRDGFCEKVPYEFVCKDGTIKSIELSAVWIRATQENRSFTLAFINDVTTENLLKDRLKQEKDTMEVTLNSIADAIVTTDDKGMITYLNPSAEKLIGRSIEASLGLPYNQVVRLYDETKNYTELSPIDVCLRKKKIVASQENSVLKAFSDNYIAVRGSIAPIFDQKNTVLGTVTVMQDVSKTRVNAQKMTYLAQHDLLTNLPNRVLLMDRLEQACITGIRERSQFSLIFLDVDNFKNINDTLGHKVGDKLLQVAADRLVRVLRKADTVCRLGGDEFILLLQNTTSSHEVAGVCKKIIKAFREPVEVDEHILNISASLGVAQFPVDGDDPEILMRRADAAMYRSKSNGRDTYTFYSQDIENEVNNRINIEKKLRRALEEKELEMYYQPIIDSKDGTLNALEALIRWKDLDGKFISPMDFIPVAEETGLINKVNYYVLDKVFTDLNYWMTQYKFLPTCTINISSHQFEDPDFVNKVRSLIEEHQVVSRNLVFEITESALITDPMGTLAVIKELSDMNIRFAIDDFGTGYSSLSYLKKFPFDILKIDREFINDLEVDASDKDFVDLIMKLATNLKLKVVAEGVEKKSQADLLTKMKCRYHQGYFYFKPMPVNDVVETFTNKNNVRYLNLEAKGNS